ncbi:hypothetical protein [Edwardsiella ictaluri]|uniref:Uncharacterized protein n=1 Tax=Edwardsiella ictaluri (strain 93-146) TaxID=634503 RepID=C5BDT7_EDWI9|nr:hypothetical protein [Edwardsiella ictaluri]ACR68634.1 hypothetical protein NT01EI_1448 [Edwardsiella ictaluri 93-146]STP88217.1 Uncharacterised protein [Edwardsiella ictaluri]
MIRVILLDDHVMVNSGFILRLILKTNPEFTGLFRRAAAAAV